MQRPLRLTLILVFFASIAHGKLALVKDLPSITESEHFEIKVSADGHSKVTRDTVIRINNDQGRESQSVQTLTYNSRSQKFKLLEAATINGSGHSPTDKVVVTPVPKADVEIKETGELSQAFDSIKQVAISYPKVKIGSRIHLRYVIESNEIPLKGFWSLGISFSGEAIEDLKIKVISALPLFHNLNDPLGRVRIENKVKSGANEISIESAEPLIGLPVQEEMPFLRPQRALSIWISTLPDWNRYAAEMIPIHQELLAQPLPAALLEIRDKAQSEKTLKEKIEKVASLIANEFRYFGDWRRRKGGYIPRTLEQIAESRYGDCKDLSLIATAIFRSLGFKADVAWVYRGEIGLNPQSYNLPIDTNFNHAISRVEADGKVYWIDATNPVAFADGVFVDIADRPVYVLAADGGRLERTPKLTPEGATENTRLAYDLQKDGSLKVSGQIQLKGRESIGLTVRSFYSPKESLNYDIIRAVSNGAKITDSSVGDFATGVRVVRDLDFPLTFTLNDIGLRTSAGFGFPLIRPEVAGRLLVETRDRVSDVYLETPTRNRTEIEIHGVRRIGKESLDCDLKAPFVDMKRSVRDIKGGVSIIDEVEVREAVVTKETIQAPEFAVYQKALRDCFNRTAVILERR